MKLIDNLKNHRELNYPTKEVGRQGWGGDFRSGLKFSPKSDEVYIDDRNISRRDPMKLEEKIRDREIVYLFRGNASIAAELGLLYYILAKRKNCRERIAAACAKAVQWLKKAQVEIPEYLGQLSIFGQLEEIEKLLVKAKVNV